MRGPVRPALLNAAILTTLLCTGGAASADATPPALSIAATHDGQRDFDYLLGSWKIHLKKRLHPLTGSNEWVEFDGTVVCRSVWNDRAEVEEFAVDSPEKHIHILGLATRLYNPRTHQWSIYWADSNNAAIDPTPQIGQFRDGRGEFYGMDTLDGTAIYVRFIWTNTSSSTPHFEQSFSADGGKTWEVNWITEQTRTGETTSTRH